MLLLLVMPGIPKWAHPALLLQPDTHASECSMKLMTTAAGYAVCGTVNDEPVNDAAVMAAGHEQLYSQKTTAVRSPTCHDVLYPQQPICHLSQPTLQV